MLYKENAVQYRETLETLEQKGHRATIKELQQVIPYHLQRYKKVIVLCKSEMISSISCSDLAFAT